MSAESHLLVAFIFECFVCKLRLWAHARLSSPGLKNSSKLGLHLVLWGTSQFDQPNYLYLFFGLGIFWSIHVAQMWTSNEGRVDLWLWCFRRDCVFPLRFESETNKCLSWLPFPVNKFPFLVYPFIYIISPLSIYLGFMWDDFSLSTATPPPQTWLPFAALVMVT